MIGQFYYSRQALNNAPNGLSSTSIQSDPMHYFAWQATTRGACLADKAVPPRAGNAAARVGRCGEWRVYAGIVAHVRKLRHRLIVHSQTALGLLVNHIADRHRRDDFGKGGDEATVESEEAFFLVGLECSIKRALVQGWVRGRAGGLKTRSDQIQRVDSRSTHTARNTAKSQQCKNTGVFLPRVFQIEQLDSLKRRHVDSRVGENADKARSETTVVGTDTALGIHGSRCLTQKRHTTNGTRRRLARHEARLERLDRINRCVSKQKNVQSWLAIPPMPPLMKRLKPLMSRESDTLSTYLANMRFDIS